MFMLCSTHSNEGAVCESKFCKDMGFHISDKRSKSRETSHVSMSNAVIYSVADRKYTSKTLFIRHNPPKDIIPSLASILYEIDINYSAWTRLDAAALADEMDITLIRKAAWFSMSVPLTCI